ncbi:uncharacterized protein F5891DRAFT_987596 [Suillus fuscotomentosus]|uniref:Uncharacterized protein n=1 Tax=Suillus fuscotomentosus TaxID=1912939 RepID=A0AAD4DPV8_9AGAM|nr:uncharacterized protein F5891DRAFT_987596 [Suillus fuscotomentosus]KAG1888987.1 hypothetical protein F5891DRAFT_987596 [Suillus fuscotomentosus]
MTCDELRIEIKTDFECQSVRSEHVKLLLVMRLVKKALGKVLFNMLNLQICSCHLDQEKEHTVRRMTSQACHSGTRRRRTLLQNKCFKNDKDKLAFNEDMVIYNDMDMDVDVDVDMGADLGVYEDEHAGVEAGYEEEVYDGAAKTYGIGTTFMKTFNSDEYAVERMDNPYFPFASKPDWEMVAFLLRSELSMMDIDKYLHLEFTRKLPLSFRSSREL